MILSAGNISNSGIANLNDRQTVTPCLWYDHMFQDYCKANPAAKSENIFFFSFVKLCTH